MNSTRWTLLAAPGWGSTIAEAALAVAGIPYDRVVLDLEREADRTRLRALNPLGQLPTAVLPDGTPLTESAAIVLAAADAAPGALLAPPIGHPDRIRFQRWLVFVVAALYPTFVYGDEPTRWVKTAPDELRASTNEHRLRLWRQLEAEARGPWFLGETRSALDLYVGVMTRWRPNRGWFAEHTPKLAAIAAAVDALPAVAPIMKENFPG